MSPSRPATSVECEELNEMREVKGLGYSSVCWLSTTCGPCQNFAYDQGEMVDDKPEGNGRGW